MNGLGPQWRRNYCFLISVCVSQADFCSSCQPRLRVLDQFLWGSKNIPYPALRRAILVSLQLVLGIDWHGDGEDVLPRKSVFLESGVIGNQVLCDLYLDSSKICIIDGILKTFFVENWVDRILDTNKQNTLGPHVLLTELWKSSIYYINLIFKGNINSFYKRYYLGKYMLIFQLVWTSYIKMWWWLIQ